jgi:Anti-sigma-K factor rskA, C-terminal
VTPHERDQLHELLADAALDRLTPEQDIELEGLLLEGGEAEKLSFELTAAELNLGLLSSEDFQPMPPRVRVRLEAAGRAWSAARNAGPMPLQRSVLGAGGARRRLVALSPWLAAAAGVTLAVLAWSPYSNADPIKRVEQDPKKIEVPFGAWAEPTDKACADTPIGCVCWSDAEQCGYLKLHKAFPCNDCDHQFQLWIIDGRGNEQRIPAGVFDCKTEAECRIFFRPSLPVHDVQSFAITMETSGGLVVSDMVHKVAIGHCGKKKQ